MINQWVYFLFKEKNKFKLTRWQEFVIRLSMILDYFIWFIMAVVAIFGVWAMVKGFMAITKFLQSL